MLYEFREASRKSEIILKRYLSNADYMSKDAQVSTARGILTLSTCPVQICMGELRDKVKISLTFFILIPKVKVTKWNFIWDIYNSFNIIPTIDINIVRLLS